MPSKRLKWLPNSMAGLIGAGALLATAPLWLAVWLSGAALERLSAHNQRLVDQGIAVTRQGAALHDQLTDLQRNARQYEVLADEQLLPVLFERTLRARDDLLQIRTGALGPEFEARISRMQGDLDQVEAIWAETQAAEDNEPILLVQALVENADALINDGRRAIDAEVAQLQQTSEQARQLSLFSSFALLPLTALLAFGMSLAVARPLRRLGAAIRRLGEAHYDEPVAVRYPREIAELAEHLDWLRRRSLKLEKDKDLFLRSVSHELKTPLASLREGADLLGDGSLGQLQPAQSEVVQILRESSRELESLIGNLLAFAEWRDERRDAAPEAFELKPMLDSIAAAHRLLMKKRGVTTQFDLRQPQLLGQKARLREALDNLVGNALKYAPDGSSIEISAWMEHGRYHIAVRDHGRGVSAADQDKIFEPFYRGQDSEQAGIRGTGIGLSIVQETMRAHAGTVEVKNAQPGACFTLVWPAPADAESADRD